MIQHYSQEELLKRIEIEHRRLFGELEHTTNSSNSSTSSCGSSNYSASSTSSGDANARKEAEVAGAIDSDQFADAYIGHSEDNSSRCSSSARDKFNILDHHPDHSVASRATGSPNDAAAAAARHRRATVSSFVPQKCANVTSAINQTKSRDRNNNAQANASNNTASSSAAPFIASEDEDEVQAVLITGCGSKMGRNIAVAFARLGLKVALVDFNTSQTDFVAQECEEQSPKRRSPLQIAADISQLDEAHKVIDRTIKEFGRLDVLVNTVNNAGLMEAKFNGSGGDDPHVFEQYHKIIANNMHSVTYLCLSAAPYLRKTKGSIVNVSSITTSEIGSYKFAYCMSKAGISTLTKCLATDLAPDIKVVCYNPKGDQ